MSGIIQIEAITEIIYSIRGKRVMLDRDLAELYGVETRRLNEQVKRNIKRFPEDFMFQLSKDEFENWKSQIAISNSIKMGLRRMPFAFTEQGVAMLSSVLNSERAIEVNIQIMRAFVSLKRMLIENEALKFAIEGLERRVSKNERNIEIAIKTIQGILNPPVLPKPKRRMGFGLPEKNNI